MSTYFCILKMLGSRSNTRDAKHRFRKFLTQAGTLTRRKHEQCPLLFLFYQIPTSSRIDDRSKGRRDRVRKVYITLRLVGGLLSTPKHMPSTLTIASSPASSWHSLPNEMKLAIIDVLDAEDVNSLSKVDQRTYQACVPAQFKVCASVTVAMEHF